MLESSEEFTLDTGTRFVYVPIVEGTRVVRVAIRAGEDGLLVQTRQIGDSHILLSEAVHELGKVGDFKECTCDL
jgi:hypothetical protein